MTAVRNNPVSSNAFHLQQNILVYCLRLWGTIKKVEDEDKHNIKDH